MRMYACMYVPEPIILRNVDNTQECCGYIIYSEEEELNSRTRNSDGIMPLQPGADMPKQGIDILMGVADH